MRASVMLHLPALGLTKQIEKVFRALQKINLAVRGLYGEGSRASGDFYQISNQVTLGKSETKILSEIREVIPQILSTSGRPATRCSKERRQARAGPRRPRARHALQRDDDDVRRDDGPAVRRAARHQPAACSTTSRRPTVNELFIHTQPAHLQKLMGHAARRRGAERRSARST